jgi:hypothetical protein
MSEATCQPGCCLSKMTEQAGHVGCLPSAASALCLCAAFSVECRQVRVQGGAYLQEQPCSGGTQIALYNFCDKVRSSLDESPLFVPAAVFQPYVQTGVLLLLQKCNSTALYSPLLGCKCLYTCCLEVMMADCKDQCCTSANCTLTCCGLPTRRS